MTTVAPSAQLWSAMPGWGIAADLTPPELINSRQLKILRRLLAGGLIILLVVCLAGYVIGRRDHSSAAGALDRAQAQTLNLEAGARKYAGITRIQGTVSQVQAEIATLMSGDVDLAKLMTELRSNLPGTMSIENETLLVSMASVASPTTGGAGTTTGLDPTTHPIIGTVTVAGSGRQLTDLATYVLKLEVLPGVVQVIPTSNVEDGKGMRFSVIMSITDQLLSHRFDHSISGTK